MEAGKVLNNWMKLYLYTSVVLAVTYLGLLVAQELEDRRQLLENKLERLRLQQEVLAEELKQNRNLLEQTKKRQEEEQLLLQKLQHWLDTWQAVELEATAYAPYDADQKGGLCHDGNSSVTATGSRPGPGTAAVDPSEIPYGTRFWVAGYGWVEAEDTGAAMRRGESDLDLFFWTRQEALEWGRRNAAVVFPRDV